MRPPDVKENYDDNTFWTQALLFAYEGIRQQEKADEDGQKHKALVESQAAMMGAKLASG